MAHWPIMTCITLKTCLLGDLFNGLDLRHVIAAIGAVQAYKWGPAEELPLPGQQQADDMEDRDS